MWLHIIRYIPLCIESWAQSLAQQNEKNLKYTHNFLKYIHKSIYTKNREIKIGIIEIIMEGVVLEYFMHETLSLTAL